MNTPTPEVVEAAIHIAKQDGRTQGWLDAAIALQSIAPWKGTHSVDQQAARILAAEVQRLRALVDEPQGKQIKPGPDKPVTEPDLYCGACGQPSAQSLWFSVSHTATCPLCAAEFVCKAGK